METVHTIQWMKALAQDALVDERVLGQRFHPLDGVNGFHEGIRAERGGPVRDSKGSGRFRGSWRLTGGAWWRPGPDDMCRDLQGAAAFARAVAPAARRPSFCDESPGANPRASEMRCRRADRFQSGPNARG